MHNWSVTAFIFPGQGSQVIGMGQPIAEAYPIARDTYAEADALLGYELSRICFEGPKERLDDTAITQPAMYVTSVAMLRALQNELPEAQPAYLAGHSLGELTALTAAGALTFADGVRLVSERGRLMKEAGDQHPGAMAALLGLSVDQVRAVCQQARERTRKDLVLANDNCPGQIVISGDSETLDIAMSIAKEAGAKRAMRLAVSVATHSPLMHDAAVQFSTIVEQTPFQPPQIPVYANITAQPLTSVDAIRSELESQLTQPVQWTDSIRAMIADGASTFVEIGAKDVLTGLLRRIDRHQQGIAVNSLDSLRHYIAQA